MRTVPIPLLTLLALFTVPAEATTSYYAGSSTEATFNSNLGTLSLISPTLDFSAYNGFFDITLTNANGTGIDFQGFNVVPDNLSVSTGKLRGSGGEQINVIFPNPGNVYAYSMHFTILSGTSNICFEPFGTSTCDYPILTVSTGTQFFGIISTAPILNTLVVRPQSGSPSLIVNDFEAYSVPESRTMLLVGLGLITLRLIRWRVQRAA